jgi:hypothetical protein
MMLNDWIHVIAGTVILAGTFLGTWLNPMWYSLAAFAGLNLLQYGFTKFCPMAVILKRFGVKE